MAKKFPPKKKKNSVRCSLISNCCYLTHQQGPGFVTSFSVLKYRSKYFTPKKYDRRCPSQDVQEDKWKSVSRQGGTMNNFNHPPKNLKLNSNSNWRFAKRNSTTRQIRQKFHFSGGGTIFTHFVFHSVGDLKHFWKSNGLDPYPWTIQGSCLGKGWLASTCARAGAPARSQAQ